MNPRPNTGWNMATTIFQKNIDCAEFMCVRFTIDSEWRRMSVSICGERNTNSNIHLTWIVLKPKL